MLAPGLLVVYSLLTTSMDKGSAPPDLVKKAFEPLIIYAMNHGPNDDSVEFNWLRKYVDGENEYLSCQDEEKSDQVTSILTQSYYCKILIELVNSMGDSGSHIALLMLSSKRLRSDSMLLSFITNSEFYSMDFLNSIWMYLGESDLAPESYLPNIIDYINLNRRDFIMDRRSIYEPNIRPVVYSLFCDIEESERENVCMNLDSGSFNWVYSLAIQEINPEFEHLKIKLKKMITPKKLVRILHGTAGSIFIINKTFFSNIKVIYMEEHSSFWIDFLSTAVIDNSHTFSRLQELLTFEFFKDANIRTSESEMQLIKNILNINGGVAYWLFYINIVLVEAEDLIQSLRSIMTLSYLQKGLPSFPITNVMSKNLDAILKADAEDEKWYFYLARKTELSPMSIEQAWINIEFLNHLARYAEQDKTFQIKIGDERDIAANFVEKAISAKKLPRKRKRN
eukprot:NODE_106_length_19857_cov_0.799980.p3 type:complete len:452 gc:universal NODE_106_length_19857_cov_0.799980:5250-3895(-)